jgi:hypothetical protein
VVAYVRSPWSETDDGRPQIIMVMADEEDQVPEKLGLAVAAEAQYQGQPIDSVTTRNIIDTYEVRSLQ